MARLTITRAEFIADPGKYLMLAKEVEVEILGDASEQRLLVIRNLPPLDEVLAQVERVCRLSRVLDDDE
jgi:hypothetical protein